jgi:WhiB family redox-sensing transcriptional regulator
MTDAYVPLTGPPTWHHAACRGEDPEMWFSSEPLEVNRYGETAVDICRRCPHAAECVTFAVETDTTHGIWGGLTPEQRDPIRPRKAGHTYSKTERWRRRQLSTADVRSSLSPSNANAKTSSEQRQRLDDAITGWSK